MPGELWVPGFAGPLDDLIARIHRRVEQFTDECNCKPAVEIELMDGSSYIVESLTPEPGYGFITIRPFHRERDDPEELIVPVGMLRRIELRKAEDQRAQFGFNVLAE